MERVPISAVIITYNEAANIIRCLDSLEGVADEILVVDSFSTDATENLCRKKGVKFLQNAFEGHIQQKNFAMHQAKYDHILSLDADEALSPELRENIINIKQSFPADAYRFNRLTSYCGHWVRHCGWYPDAKLRLWDRRKGQWGGENPHDHIIMQTGCDTRHIPGDLLHYSFPSITSHIRTANNFSDIAAREAFKKGKKANFLVHVLLNPAYTFLNKYFIRGGFRDGYYGFIICWISGFANFLKYLKIREMHKNNGK